MAALSMKDLEAAVDAGAAAASARPDGLVLQQSEGGSKTRWSFEDETPEPSDERPINADVAVKTCAGSIGVGLFARRHLEGGSVILRGDPIAHAARGFDGARCSGCLCLIKKFDFADYSRMEEKKC